MAREVHLFIEENEQRNKNPADSISFIRGARKKNKESLRAGAKAVIKEAADQVHVFYIRKF